MSRRPLGYAIVGGVLFSTALTLFLVPVVYSLMEGVRVRVGARAGTPRAPAGAVRWARNDRCSLLAALGRRRHAAAAPIRLPRITLTEALQRAARLDPELRPGPRRRWTMRPGPGAPP